MNSMDRFVALGDEVAQRWEARNLNSDDFSEIATSSLEASDVLITTTLEDIAGWLTSSRVLPAQTLRDFGQPPINLYNGRGFHIELLVWVDVPTSIHQHAFHGAWGVLRGSSLHSEYSFAISERINDQLLLGELTYRSSEFLKRGDVRTIYAGDRFMHSLLHLEPPSVSVVVRTENDTRYHPQYTYYPPSLAADPFYRPEPLATQLVLLESLRRTEPPLFWSLALSLVQDRDLWMAYKVLEIAAFAGVENENFVTLMEVLRSRHASMAEKLSAMLVARRQKEAIVHRLKTTTQRDHRLLLALLLSVPNRDSILHVVRASFPSEDPVEKLMSWLRELADIPDFGLSLDKASSRVLEYILRDATHAQIQEAWTSRFGSERPAVEALQNIWKQIHSSELWLPLTMSGQNPARREAIRGSDDALATSFGP